MVTQKRSEFLATGAGAALLAATSAASARPGRQGLFTAPKMRDEGAEHLSHGYPDECYSFTTFADSLVALAWGHGWYAQPPYVGLRNAIIVDFSSATEDEAEASLAHGWNGAWEFPMGSAATVSRRVEVDAQNAKIWRQLSIIGTGVSSDDFHAKVIEPLLDARSCSDRTCSKCRLRGVRHLEDVFIQLALGMDQGAIQLFSRWQPSSKLLTRVEAAGVRIIHHPLGEIPKEDLEANRAYHIWDGTPLQAEAFRKAVWAPAWRRKKNALVVQ
jgi:hypothetical protein